jgi:hypothetical protein
MSIELSSSVWKIPMSSPGRKIVALALADMANKDGSCWPSLRILSDRCSIQPDSIRAHIHGLSCAGIIRIMPQFRENRQTSNIYTFASLAELDRLQKTVSGEAGVVDNLGGGEIGRGVDFGRGGLVKNGRGEGGKKQEGENHHIEPIIEPPQEIVEKPEVDGSLKNIPTTTQSKRIAAIFHRKETTPWQPNEIKAYKLLGQIDEQDLNSLESYYSSNWPPTRGKNILRTNLITLLNNFQGEVERAKAAEFNNGQPSYQDRRDMSPSQKFSL